MRLLSNLLILFTVISFISCSGQEEKAKTEKAPAVVSEQAAPEPSTSLPDLKDPCEILSAADIVSIDGFNEASEGRPNLAGSDTWKICDFMVDKRSLSTSMKRYRDRIIETKGVERTYQKILETKDKLNRMEVQDGPGDQAIYTYGKKGVSYSYLLQWRYENHTEGMISMSFGKKQNAEKLLGQLKAIAAKLDQ